MPESENQSPSPYQAPSETVSAAPVPAAPVQSEGDATGGVIPYKNLPALLAYYLGLFSLFPLLGFFLAVPAFVLGIIGLKKRRENPAIKGSVHAWIGIVMGGLFSVIWGLMIVSIIVAVFAADSR